MILRNTLKKSDIIRTAVEYARHISRGHPLNVDPTMPTGEDSQHNIQLSAQLLRCCQALYNEAYSILYEENQLSITVSDSRWPYCNILDVSIGLPHDREYWFMNDSSLLDQCEMCSIRRLPIGVPKLEEPLTAAAKISHVRLTILCDGGIIEDNTTRSLVLTACRSLRRFLVKKRPTLVILKKHEPLGSIAGTLPVRKLLSGSKYLRCQSITFEGFASHDTSELAQLITGDEPVYDVLGMQCALLYSPNQVLDEEYLKTLEAAYDVDYAEFQRLRRSIVNEAEARKRRLVY